MYDSKELAKAVCDELKRGRIAAMKEFELESICVGGTGKASGGRIYLHTCKSNKVEILFLNQHNCDCKSLIINLKTICVLFTRYYSYTQLKDAMIKYNRVTRDIIIDSHLIYYSSHFVFYQYDFYILIPVRMLNESHTCKYAVFIYTFPITRVL